MYAQCATKFHAQLVERIGVFKPRRRVSLEFTKLRLDFFFHYYLKFLQYEKLEKTYIFTNGTFL